MTREERAITNLKQMCSDGRYLGSGSYAPLEVLEDFALAIKALEQEPTTKNNLGVDCVSRRAIIDEMEKRHAKGDYITKGFVKNLPSVTPQESKTGHWILTDIEDYRVWYCNCSECGKDPQDYIGGSEDWWLIRNNLPKFCPNCGAKMEIKE